jgi:Flp pilus assembly protein TadB
VEGREQRTKTREQKAESRDQGAQSREQRAESREQRSEKMEQEVRSTEQRAESRKQRAGREGKFMKAEQNEDMKERSGSSKKLFAKTLAFPMIALLALTGCK